MGPDVTERTGFAGRRYASRVLSEQAYDDAFDDYVAFLEEMRPSATGEWALGEARYSALLREKELLGFDARGLRDRGQAAYDELSRRVDRLVPRLTAA